MWECELDAGSVPRCEFDIGRREAKYVGWMFEEVYDAGEVGFERVYVSEVHR